MQQALPAVRVPMHCVPMPEASRPVADPSRQGPDGVPTGPLNSRQNRRYLRIRSLVAGFARALATRRPLRALASMLPRAAIPST
ncbi:hypothetical protein YW7DRAFT_01086 [Streptomyces sp. AmelKG-E11A]|nr:hypothetical protein YW7DRAFT_01086 [Streptomyces sp. AmelKG-E11A]